MTITPNHITLFRIVSVPLIVFCIIIEGRISIAGRLWTTLGFILFVLAAVSDWLDGYLARKTNTISVFGRVFDSIADKLLISGVMLALAYVGGLLNGLIFPALIILLREIFVAGLRECVMRVQSERASEPDETEPCEKPRPALATTDLAKLKTVLQMVGLGMLIIAPYPFHPYFGLLGGLIFWASAVLSVTTGWQYWKEARPAIIRASI